jgi:cell wall-associated NlpC family hydrolase
LKKVTQLFVRNFLWFMISVSTWILSPADPWQPHIPPNVSKGQAATQQQKNSKSSQEKRQPGKTQAESSPQKGPGKNEQGFILGDKVKGWADVYSAPDRGGQRVRQVLIGEAIRVLDQKGEWSEFETVRGDMWQGWALADHLSVGAPGFRKGLQSSSSFVIVGAPSVSTKEGPALPFGAELPGTMNQGGVSMVLPNDQKVHVEANDVRLANSVPLKDAVLMAKDFVGVRYRSGGNTAEAMDNAGLICLVFGVAGINVARNLETLRNGGVSVSPKDLKTGDIVFFSTYDSRNPHPVLAVDDGTAFLEASSTWGVYFGAFEEMKNHKILDVRRYRTPDEAGQPKTGVSRAGKSNAVVAGPKPAVKETAPQNPRIQGPAVLQEIPRSGEAGFVLGSKESGLWADIYRNPDASSERISQALVGDCVKVRRLQNGWAEVQLYDYATWTGWMRSENLCKGDNAFRKSYAGTKWVVVKAPGVRINESLFMPYAAVLPKCEGLEDPCGLLPDGRKIRFNVGEVKSAGSITLREALESAKGLRHLRYERGANTLDAVDAAGLIFLLFRVANIQVPRDATELMQGGAAVSHSSLKQGDIVFYSTFDSKQPHPVILLDEGTTFLEASPASGVNLGLTEQMRNREIVAIRRYMPLRGY